MTRTTLAARLAAAIVLLVALAGCATSGGDPLAEGSATADADGATAEADGATGDEDAGGGTVTVGSADFAEQLILGNMAALVLQDAGLEVETQLGLGAREVVFPAMESGDVDVVMEYLGATYAFLSEGQGEVLTDVEELRGALEEVLPEGLVLFESSSAQDQDALAVTAKTSEEYGLEAVSDLAPVAAELVAGGPAEEETRPTGLVGLREVYGIEFSEFVVTDAGGPQTVAALKEGRIDVGRVFTTSGFLQVEDFVVLAEDKPLIPAENITPIAREDALTPAAREALDALAAALTTEDLITLNARVEVDKDDPDVVAREWLEEKGLLGG